jgi:hypothetical protein
MTTKTEATSYQRLREHLAYLGMTAAAEHLSIELDRAHKDKLSATQVLESLLDIEVIATKARRTRGRLRFAHDPVHFTAYSGESDQSFRSFRSPRRRRPHERPTRGSFQPLIVTSSSLVCA